MDSYKTYKETHSLAQRQQKQKEYAQAEPDKFILIAERHPKSMLPSLNNPKLLCPKAYKYGQMKHIIEKKLVDKMGTLPKDKTGKQSFFAFIGKQMPSLEEKMGPIYEKFKDPEDNILYVTYQELESF